ncbi:MAG: glycosyltransferase [Candidatus Bathyarchaeia archaeon]|jgi:glycogen synthase
MRVILFSWEYPPRVVGKLAEYVSALSNSLEKNKVDTYVVTYHDYLTGSSAEASGVKVLRVFNPVKTHIGVLTWVLTLNQEVERAAANIYYDSDKKIDLIDVFDWHFVPAAVALKNGLGIPFVYSIESLEDHRSLQSNSPYNMAIKSIEWLGCYESSCITVKSEWMKEEVARVYNVPKEKIVLILTDPEKWPKNTLKTYKNAIGGAKAEA